MKLPLNNPRWHEMFKDLYVVVFDIIRGKNMSTVIRKILFCRYVRDVVYYVSIYLVNNVECNKK